MLLLWDTPIGEYAQDDAYVEVVLDGKVFRGFVKKSGLGNG